MQQHIDKIREYLWQKKLDGLLISNATNISYIVPNTHFSSLEREAFVLITINETFLFTDSRYTGALKGRGKPMKIIECGATSTFFQEFSNIVRHEKLGRVSIEENNLTVTEMKKLKKSLEQGRHPLHIRFSDAAYPIEKLRVIKTPKEIKSLQQACKITDMAFSYILTKIKRSMSELDIATELELFIRQKGVELAFPTIVAFGKNAAVPHHHTGKTKLVYSGTPILFDFGARVDGYCADMSRTIFYGKITPQLEQQYKAAAYAQTKALYTIEQAFKTESKSIPAADPDKVVRAIFKEAKFPDLPHALGHGVGLEVHEAPVLSYRSKDILKPGMTVTVEPGIYLRNKAGIRIEDTIVITEKGVTLLTRSPKSIIIL